MRAKAAERIRHRVASLCAVQWRRSPASIPERSAAPVWASQSPPATWLDCVTERQEKDDARRVRPVQLIVGLFFTTVFVM